LSDAKYGKFLQLALPHRRLTLIVQKILISRHRTAQGHAASSPSFAKNSPEPPIHPQLFYPQAITVPPGRPAVT